MTAPAIDAPIARATSSGTNRPRVDRAEVLSAIPSLSVIIPARNEEHALGSTLECVRSEHRGEIIVVDGRSDDRTCEVARSYDAVVIASPPNRGMQLRIGADSASGEHLLFLHADTLLPGGFRTCVTETLAGPDVIAGAFRLAIDAPGLGFRMIESAVQFRSSTLELPYGDQALFIRADALHRVGGYRDLPVMEDFELVRRLRAAGRIVIAPSAVRTSARRWLKNGPWRTTSMNLICVVAYMLGVSPGRIAQWRRIGYARSENIARS